MASQCKRQQCTIDRRGFRQELDSWRHKLVHCVGFESILEGLFAPELVEDLKLFKDFEPTAVSDWSFDENCLFCCLRRDKVKEHLIGLSDEGLEDTAKPLLVKDQTAISRLEKQAEEFLNAVLCRKDVPNFSDPHIPVVAREILQKMIRQFAAEYTSKTSSPQDSGSDSQPCSDQSLPTPPLLSGAPPPTSPAATLAGPAHNQNPVLSKLLMADQDAPLDLTIKRPLAVPSEQDGVLDLSIKKNRHSSSSLPVCSPCFSPATSTLKGESHDLPIAKVKDLQSTSTLEQFMAKLCPHHQRQIVDAIGFLQTEVKALTSSNTQQASKSTSGIQGTPCSTAKSNAVTPEKSCHDLRFPSESTPKSEVQDMSLSIPSSCAMKQVPEDSVSPKTSAGPALDLRSPGSGSNQALVTPTANPVDAENNRNGDHAPLKMKIMTSNVAAGKKLSCVLNASLSSQSDTLEDRQGNANSFNRTETHSARLSSSVKRHNQNSHTHQVRQRDTLGYAKDNPANLFSVHMTIPSDSPRTARKTIRPSSDHRIRDSAFRGMADPDLGHCDIVFIDKPITECFKEQRRRMLPRRNARKSTRGHMYSDEIWELKTVRTLAGRGNCRNPMPELITLVTPKQVLSKPEGVPPVDIHFAGACRETMNQQMSTEESDESVIPGTGDMVEVAASDETSQTDQCQSKGQTAPSSPIRSPTENKETDMNTNVEQEKTGDTWMTITGSEESVAQAPFEAEKDNEPEPQEDIRESNEQIVTETVVEPLEDITIEEDEPQQPSDKLHTSEPILLQNSAPSPVAQTEEGIEENKREKIQDDQPQELQPETQIQYDNVEVTEKSNTTGSAEEPMVTDREIQTSEAVDSVMPSETEGDNDDDVSSKTLDALLKELPPWRRKKGAAVSLPKQLKKTEAVVVGFVNGRPVSASDRSLRRRSSNSSTSPSKTPVKSSQNVPNKTPVDSTIENKMMEKDLPETDIAVKSNETTPVIQQVEEPSSATPLSAEPSSATLSSAEPSSATLSSAEPSTATLSSAEPSSATLSSAEPSSATLLSAEPSSATLSSAESSTATLSSAEPSTATLSSAEPSTATLLSAEPSSAEQSSTTPSSPTSKFPPRTKPSRKQKRVQRDQDSLPVFSDQRQLRSASQRPAGTPVSPPKSNAVTSISSPKPTATHALPSTEHLPSSPLPSSLPVTSPPIRSSSSAASEQCQQHTVLETTVESNTENTQPVETTSEETQKNEEENRSQAKQKLQSKKALVDNGKSEEQQLSGEVTSPLESPVKTEIQTQIMPLRSKRVLQKEAEAGDVALPQKPNVASLGGKSASGDDSSSSVSDKPTRMPLRSESSKAEMSHQPVTQSSPVDNKKLALRSQKLVVPSTSALTVAGRQSDAASPIRTITEKVTKAQVKPPPVSVASVLPHSSAMPVTTPRSEPPKQTNKFLENLTGEDNQQLISNLNIKYDKMQKGWVQLDKEGQPVTKYKNKADRQAAIWKSKRRARKSKSSEHQKYSPVQMLFMKGFNLTSICRWFLDTTETKSLVIVKKVNTRLPSETQLCFHSSSSASGTSQGVFPSLQAERLKKHLKKFAIASPVKSNPKSQKLIAKALEQEANAVKGKERRELPNTTPTLTMSHSSAKACGQMVESQKSSGKSKNPASARILRKYSNIREKMQVQQTNVRLKEASKTLKTNNMKRLATKKSAAKSNLKPSLKAKKSPLPIGKQMKASAAKMERRKTLVGKKTTKHPVQQRAVKAQSSSKASKNATKKDKLPKRCSQRLGSPKISDHNPVDTSKSKVDNKKQIEAEKVEVEKPAVNKVSAAKVQTKGSTQSTVAEIKGTESAVEIPQHSMDVKAPTSPDQVLTRSQRKMEAAVPLSGSPSPAPKRAKKSKTTQNASPKPVRKSEVPTLTRRGALKSLAKTRHAASLPRSVTKSATKRARELLETPAKRTRTSLSK
ncbi:mucin-17 isoform X1 [Sebastes umbrosus]|uniref:mucin-17 isoform X1 n=1 Tax=Sebastes umbrosus TaxID=72105 RepID=UPI00189DC8AC|nr:mucin-17 isoform X1 [Sebastes umbrosus]